MEGEAEGLAARVMQHELDHLDGVLYPMRMDDLSLLGFTEELARAAAEQTERAAAEARAAAGAGAAQPAAEPGP